MNVRTGNGLSQNGYGTCLLAYYFPALVRFEERLLVWRPVPRTDRDLLDGGFLDGRGRAHLNGAGLECALDKRELLHEVASIDALGTSPPGSPSNDALVPCSATVDRVRFVGTYATRGTNVQS